MWKHLAGEIVKALAAYGKAEREMGTNIVIWHFFDKIDWRNLQNVTVLNGISSEVYNSKLEVCWQIFECNSVERKHLKEDFRLRSSGKYSEVRIILEIKVSCTNKCKEI